MLKVKMIFYRKERLRNSCHVYNMRAYHFSFRIESKINLVFSICGMIIKLKIFKRGHNRKFCNDKIQYSLRFIISEPFIKIKFDSFHFLIQY